MSGSRARVGLAALADRPVLSARDFVRFVALPNIIWAVTLLATTSVIGFGPTELLSRLTVIGLLILLTFIVHGGMEIVDGRFLARMMGGLVGLLSLFYLAFNLNPLANLYLPLAGLVLSSGVVSLPRRDRFLLAGGAILSSLVLGGLGLFLFSQTLASLIIGAAALTFSLIFADVWGCRRDATTKKNFLTPSFDSSPPVHRDASAEPHTLATTARESKALADLAEKIFVQESLAEFAWRLPLLMLLTGGMVVALAYISHGRSVMFGICWLILAGIQLMLLQQLPRQKTAKDLHRRALLIVLAQLGWWLLLDRLTSQQTLYPDLLAGILIFGFGSLPWLRREAWLLVMVVVLLVCSRIPLGKAPELVLLALCFGVPLALRMAAINYLNFVTRAALSLIRRVSESVSSTEAVLIMFAAQLARIGDTRGVLVLIGSERAYLAGQPALKQITTDTIFQRGLLQVVKESEKTEGILTLKQLGPQYVHPCFNWFGFVPRQLGYVEVSAVIAERPERVVMLFPISLTVRLAGLVRTFRSIGVIGAVMRLWLGGQRNRFVSDDLLLSTQRAVSQREEELSQIVHQVNNIAQDFSVLLDQLKDQSKESEASNSILEQLDKLTRCLAIGVSDVRVARELGRIVQFEGAATRAVGEVLGELCIFGEYRAERRGFSFVVKGDLEPSALVEVCNSDLFETALRLLLRLTEERIDDVGKIQLNVTAADKLILWTFLGNGRSFEPEEIQAFAEEGARQNQTSQETEYFRAILNFARLSRGRLDVLTPTEEFSTAICLAVPRGEVKDKLMSASDGWALLVDDNPQVIIFYARIAEALSLPYATASGVAQALEILQTRGVPRIVLTDLQLGNESGLDLVRYVRKTFPSLVPVVVVSGNTGPNVANEVTLSGATLFLQKPVGRGKLVAEIRRILSLSGEP